MPTTRWSKAPIIDVGPFGHHDPVYVARKLKHLTALATLMDGAFIIPGLGVRMGLAGLVGAIPFAGDMVGGAVSTYIVWEAYKLGAPQALIAQMLLNVAIETGVGSVPVIGDMFDILFRANLRNVGLLRDHLEGAQRL